MQPPATVPAPAPAADPAPVRKKIKDAEISLAYIYENYDRLVSVSNQRATIIAPNSALEIHMHKYDVFEGASGFSRMANCRRALAALDRRGWERSYHQKLFHDQYIRACSRVFFKSDADGAFNRAHQKILELNGWDSLPQEVLISTPRRFGKTISVSMFAAAMIFSCPKMELSIYSTCKRISQKLLRNIVKFLEIIVTELEVQPHKVLRMNSEEIHIKGNEGSLDVRVVNSYPSKVGFLLPLVLSTLPHSIAPHCIPQHATAFQKGTKRHHRRACFSRACP
jgi:hypothetical protein